MTASPDPGSIEATRHNHPLYALSDSKELRQRQVGVSLHARAPRLRRKLSDIVLLPKYTGTRNLDDLEQRQLIAPAIAKTIRLETLRLRGDLGSVVRIGFLDADHLRSHRDAYYGDPVRLFTADNTRPPWVNPETVAIATDAELHFPELGFAARLATRRAAPEETTKHDLMLAHEIVDYLHYSVSAFQRMRYNNGWRSA